LLVEEQFAQALHRVVIGELPLTNGKYVWTIQTPSKTFALPFIKQ